MKKPIQLIIAILFLLPIITAITWSGSGNNYYGEMWYMNHTGTEINFVVPDIWYSLFFTDADKLNGFNYTGGFNTSSNLTALINGTYKACYEAGGSGQNNHKYFTDVLINGVETEKCMSHKTMAAGGDITTMNGCCLIDLVIGDNIALATKDYDSTGAGAYYSSNLNLVRIGD